MMTIEKFTEEIVKIDWVESSNCFGHYPFYTWVQMPGDKVVIAALALDDVRKVYQAIDKFLSTGALRILSAVDYPANKYIETDFVLISEFINGDIESFILPYDQAGNRLPIIRNNPMIDMLKSQMKLIMKHITATA